MNFLVSPKTRWMKQKIHKGKIKENFWKNGETSEHEEDQKQHTVFQEILKQNIQF